MNDMTQTAEPITAGGGLKSLLVVDDDAAFRRSLARALERRGYEVQAAESLAEARSIAPGFKPDGAVLDMKLEDGTGLDLVQPLRDVRDDMRIVILTSYGNIATAVAAVKAGAVDYLSKPADADMVEAALRADPEAKPTPPEAPMSADRVRWEHIQRIFEQCDRNVSETARRLRMHRRTLQRILSKHAPRS